MSVQSSALQQCVARGLVGLAAALAGCGGGGGSSTGTPNAGVDCSVPAQQTWLSDYMNEWYFWYRQAPAPAPASYPTLDSYFAARLFTGDATFARDRYSFSQSTTSFDQFYGEGKTLGYGVFVAGVEVTGRPDLPLRVRYVEPLSDAAARGLQRGDEVLALNGRAASDAIAANDFSALTPRAAGDTLVLRLRGPAGERSVTLTASAYTLTPVSGGTLLRSPAGRSIGYVMIKDMISQTAPGLQSAFAQFKTAGVTELVLDLRYNGGGLVSTAGEVASYASGARANGGVFATLAFNDKRAAANNQTFSFSSPAAALALPRVFVLMGSRTCSASELVINGLRGIGIEVVAIGSASCGKPVGFLPAAHCDTTFNVVNFESLNARGQGRYFDGIAPTCAVADDLTHALGAADEALVGAARAYADTGACPATASLAVAPTRRGIGAVTTEPGERQGMVAR